MNNPAGSSMSLTAILVLTVVVLVLIAGWLGAVFYSGRQTGGATTRPNAVDPGQVSQPQAGALGDAPAGRAG